MSTAADGARTALDVAPVPSVAAQELPLGKRIVGAEQETNKQHETRSNKQSTPPTFLHSPPDSNNATKSEASDSELSDLDDEPSMDDVPMPAIGDRVSVPRVEPVDAEPEEEPREETKEEPKREPMEESMEEPKEESKKEPLEEPEAQEDIGEVLPHDWSGQVPIFKPTMEQFKDFKRFMEKVDAYGMKSGIIKIVPPDDWKDSLPQLDELVKNIRVREPIKQDMMGSNGTYRQVNILHGRSYSLPQWRQLCEQSEHQPPARRGERRANADKPKLLRAQAAASKAANPSTPGRRGGRRGRGRGQRSQGEEDGRPMTPVSPKAQAQGLRSSVVNSIEKDVGVDADDHDHAPVGRMGAMRQSKPKTQSTSARRKYSRREGSAMIDEAAFKDFDYRMDISDYTPERCEELERSYWKTLTYAPPLYGADMMGTLFDEAANTWNLNKLPNLLDVLGTKVPGVNTAYLYLGMWKATFAWHLEDVDLYSINYLHFGAPKQWYSISQGDARRFEAAMKSVWPSDAGACNQFLRHKSFLISPQHLLQHYGIKVNKVVCYPGEFVVTYPYGYHSGYNLGYNCAEAVNFALDSWLDMGKIAKRCECAQAQDSVWIDVHAIERKLRGEETEYEETEDEDEDEEDDEDEGMSGLPTPPVGHGAKFKHINRKRKRGPYGKGATVKVKKIKLRLKRKRVTPCCLCPNDTPGLELLRSEDGQKAHRLCALYLPETFIDTTEGEEVVHNVSQIHKDRLNLKCLFCRSKLGACFQCSQKKCARSYHASCAAAAGVFVEEEGVPVFGEDGTEYKEQAFEFSCRYHRTKRDKKLNGDALEANARIQAAAEALETGEICQLQYYKGEIFAGIVVENRTDERALLVDILPAGDRVEVEWKWLLLADPSDHHLPKASAKAIPLPASQKAKEKLNAKPQQDDKPKKGDAFVDGCTWAEFHTAEVSNPEQVKIELSKPDQIWHYLGRSSTDSRSQFTEDPSKPRYNPSGNFLKVAPRMLKRPVSVKAPVRPQPSYTPSAVYPYSYTGMTFQRTTSPLAPLPGFNRPNRPYVYKPRTFMDHSMSGASPAYTQQRLVPTTSATPPPPSASIPQHRPASNGEMSQGTNTYSAQRFAVSAVQNDPARTTGPSYQNAAYGNAGIRQAPLVHHSLNQSRPATTSLPLPKPPASVQRPAPTAPRPQSKPNWQIYSSAYQKYPFFQIHHNRDASKYRTPYAPWGGFTNGYQGDLRAHLTANQGELARRPSLGSVPIAQEGRSTPAGTQGPPSTGWSATPPPVSSKLPASVSSDASARPSNTATQLQGSAARPSQKIPAAYTSQFHRAGPAIKPDPQFAARAHQVNVTQIPQHVATGHSTSTPAKANTSPVFNHYKVGLPAAPNPSPQSSKSATHNIPKQSPVPLPANFLAAMTPSSITPASNAQLSPLLAAKSGPAAAVEPLPTLTDAISQELSLEPPQARESFQKTPPTARVSTTPVPLPRMLGTALSPAPHAAAPSRPVPDPQAGQMDPRALHPTVDQTPAYHPSLLSRDAQLASRLPMTGTGHTGAGESSTHQSSLLQSAPRNSSAHQEFADVPGCESMEFVDRMMHNLRRASFGRQAY